MREALTIQQELGAVTGVATCLVGLAEEAHRCGHDQHAAQLLGAAATLRVTAGKRGLSNGKDRDEQLRSRIRSALSAAEFAGAWAMGQARSLEAATDLGLAAAAHLLEASR